MGNIGTWFRWTAIAEACSWTGLLVGMFFKYVVVHNEIGVKIFGPIHGGLFLAYLVSVIVLARTANWGKGRTVVGVLAAVPPFTTLLFERFIARQPAATASERVPASVG